MSTINTNSIDVNYPIPGVNNSSQGFRDNFTSIKTNLDTAAEEITDLENKVVVKSALNNQTLNNDMANTLISNAAIRSFRNTTYNLGNALSGLVQINASLGDVQYGNVAGNITLAFGGWAPTNTLSKLQLQLGISNGNAVISFPSSCVIDGNHGVGLLENFANIANTATLTVPYNVTELHLELVSTDCGNTVFVTPVNRPYQSTQISKRTPPLTGQPGDFIGTVSIDAEVGVQLNVTSSTSTDFFVTANTATLFTGMPITFTGTSFESNVVSGAIYYVGNIANTTHFKISANANASGNVNLAGSSGNMLLNPVKYMYVATDNYSANAYAKNIANTTGPNTITLSSGMANIAVNYPVIFGGAGAANANLTIGKVYYIKSVSGSNISISQTIDNGIAGATYENIATYVPGSPPAFAMTVYDGPQIFKKIPLVPGTDVPTSADISDVSKIKIGGGTNGYVLTTDGTGNLAWASGGGSGNGTVAGSNTQIQYNNAGSFGATAGFTFNSATSLLSIPGNVTATGNITTDNITVSNIANIGNLTVTNDVTLTNVTATGQVVVTGNIIGGNLVTNGNLSVTGNANIGNVGTSSLTVVTGIVSATAVIGNASITANLDAGNLAVTGIANITGNVFSNSNIASNVYFISSTSNNVTAFGTSQSDATQLTKEINYVQTTPASTGVKLPTAVEGLRIVVRNGGANALLVYPGTGAKINALAVNAGYSLATASSIEFFCVIGGGSGQWFTL